MSNWKKNLNDAVWKNDLKKVKLILSQEDVKRELPQIDTWNLQ